MSQITQLWNRLDSRQRTTLGLVVALTVGAVIALTVYGRRPDYRVLYGDLSPQDAGAVADYLQSKGQPYRLAAGGSAVEVGAEQVYALRNTLAQAGLPRGAGGVGFELFDKSGLPGSEFSNQVSYQRAQQGELERTISSLEKVRSARVHLVLAKNDLYGAEQQASASVMVETRSGQQLSSREVDGIVNLVAGGVRGLKPQAISLVDSQGNVLNDATNAGGAKLSMSQMETRREYEQELQVAMQGLLDRSLGENQAIVRVQADLDFDQQRVTSHSVLPTAGRGSVLEEKVSEERYTGGPGAKGGVAGISANLGPGGAASGTGGNGAYSNRQESRQFEYTKEEKELVKAPGQIRRLTVAVALDSQAAVGAEKQVAELLKATAGLNDRRGDVVTVQRLELAAKKQAEEAKKESDKQAAEQRTRELMALAARVGTPLLLAVIIGGGMLMGAKQLRGAGGLLTEAAGTAEHVTRVAAAVAEVSPETGAASPGPREESPQVEGSPPGDLSRLARENPRLVAQQLRRWIGDTPEES